ncbi:CesT family type III secretion system chaperone [Parendozoicomonas sp. Alg238-R29]|uniref:CesT family type III secretion system chaperone n=1 Tax=Parendozoicomonas sp. Alg238-R29 TaxID=2993446 RepID=UPI00248E9BA2|nr:CesT family type III secretion system chaperone [Parendozoicomonas sp. Alg238-R29]
MQQMNLDELITKFSRNNGIDKLENNNGRYLIEMEGVDVSCYEDGGKYYLLSDLGPLSKATGQRQSDTRLLLDKSLGLIRDQRSSLTLDEAAGVYQLYQRLPSDVLIEDFQEAIESFGGCCLYYQGLLGQNSGSGGVVPPAGGMML